MQKNCSYVVWLTLILLLLSSIPTAYASDTFIRVGVKHKTPPFQFLNSSGDIDGLHIDMMNRIAKEESLLIEYVPFGHSTEALEALAEGEIDVLLGSYYSKDIRERGIFEATELSIANISMVVGKKNFTKIFGTQDGHTNFKSAFELGTISFSQALSFNEMSTQVMGDQQELFDALINNKVDAVLGIKESMLYQLDQAGLSEEYAITSNYLSSVHFFILTLKNDRVLSNAIRRSMDRLRRRDDYEDILDDWIIDRNLVAQQKKFQKIVKFILGVGALILIVLIFFAYLNSLLKNSIEEKSREIAKQMKELDYESSLRSKLIEYSPEGIMLLQPDGEVLLMNPQAKQISGLYTFSTPIYINQLPVFREVWKECGSGLGENCPPRTISWFSPDRRKHVFRYQLHPLGLDQDLILMVQDVTIEEQEKMDAFEADKSRSLNRIVAGISHEIKNPLTSIRAFSSLIGQQGSEKDFQESFAYYVPREVDRIDRLIESLINYARPVQGTQEDVFLKELIEEALILAGVASLKDRIHLCSEIPENLSIQADRNQLLQVMVNLLINSIDAIKEKIALLPENDHTMFSIHLHAKERQTEVLLELVDEGMGMSQQQLEECFEPFFTTKAHGFGMGLSLAKHFLQKNNATLSLQSEEGIGTWITIVFHDKEVA